jgi:hypothetical protein
VTSRRFLRGFWISVLTLCVVVIVATVWTSTRLLYPGPENESAFLRHYTPERVIRSFACNQSSTFSHYSSSAAGRKYVSRKAGQEWIFAIRAENWMAMMHALKQDASEQLVSNGAQILSENGDPRNGFHFSYQDGHIVGSLTILPFAVSSSLQRATPLPQGLADIRARIEQSEMWFPNNPGMIQTSVNNSVH